MITKERLEELIKQSATVYTLMQGKIEKIDLAKARIFGRTDNYTYIEYWCNTFEYYIETSNERLYETKEQAKWHLDNTFERTERLKLPMWEEFYNHSKTIDNYRILFTSKDRERIELCVCGNIDEADPESIVIFNLDNDLDQSYLFDKLANEENYKEACKLCGKLFIGEE